MNLQQEAENYGWKIKMNNFSDPVKANDLANSAINDFIAGVNSKNVEKQKIEFAISELSKCLYPKGTGVKKKIQELENRLSDII